MALRARRWAPPATQPPLANRTAVRSPAFSQAAAPARILIVDDVPDNLNVLGAVLERAGYLVTVSLDGPGALRLAQRAPAPDLILLDVMMPGMDGHEVLARLRADPATASIPVLFVTALGDPEDEELGLSLGAVDYLTDRKSVV